MSRFIQAHRKKLLIGLILVILILTVVVAGILYRQNESNIRFWVAGESVTIPASPEEFPAVFPTLYKTTSYQETPEKAENIVATAEYENGTYCFAKIFRAAERTEIQTFSMMFGEPGNMTAWGVTFGMTREEAEAAMERYLGHIPTPAPIEEVWRMWEYEYRPDFQEKISESVEYRSSGQGIRIAYDLDGRVCGMQILDAWS